MINHFFHVFKRGSKQLHNIIANPLEAILRFKFILKMNLTCHKIGMRDTRLLNASGASSYSYSTPHDLLTLLNYIPKFPQITELCGMSFADVRINNRLEHLRSNIYNCEEYYNSTRFPILYAKTGSWGNSHKAIVARCLVNTDPIDIAIMVSDAICFENIFGILSDTIDVIIRNKMNETRYFQDLLRAGGGYCALYRGDLYQHNENKRFLIASVSKLITAICIFEGSKNSNLVILRQDIVGSAGLQLKESDYLSEDDAIKMMLIESSNTAAEALGRAHGADCKWF